MFSSARAHYQRFLEYINEHRGETYHVLIDKSHVRWDGLYIACLCLHLSELIQVQLRKLEPLLTLGDLGVKVDQALGFSKDQERDMAKSRQQDVRVREYGR